MMNRARGVCWGLVLAAMTACGGDNGGGGVDTGLPEDKQASELTQAEAEMACQEIAAAFDRQFSPEATTELLCRLVGLISGYAAGQSESVCNEAVDECIRTGGENVPQELDGFESIEVECTGDLTADLQDCSATVGELEMCLNDTLAMFDDLSVQLSCSNIDQVEQDAEGNPDFSFLEPSDPASCTELEAQCPGFLDAMTTTM